MSAHMLFPTTSNLPVPRSAPGRSRTPGRPKREWGSSPREGERLRPLTRGQVEDRLQELGPVRGVLRRWPMGVERGACRLPATPRGRRTTAGVLVADRGDHGPDRIRLRLPVGGAGPWWAGFDGHVRGSLLRRVAPGRLFVVSGIVVASRVCREYQDRAWNLTRRLQRRLLADHGAALGVTSVEARDDGIVETFRSWGWRSAADGTLAAVPPGSCRVLVLTAGT